MFFRTWHIIVVRVFRVEDPEATGDLIKYWLLQLGAQVGCIAMLFLKNYLFMGGATWRQIVGDGIFGGAVANVYLHIKTPKVKARVEEAKQVEDAVNEAN